ncbi:WXG100 family type VII secretion target [Flexivirga oryzae]|uniref:Uncharacterized protein YbaA (DUF1428 family) n=1 Tax=Flexivirga oryzae TaxID=1794944 RepID=A0A839N5F2_9MICO|nr:hypothetical protein [Flexivirga oryzae]MBB2890866.1 uncharacterized protein YbaA (DUF1428 family) [Flexivirga oryzae]
MKPPEGDPDLLRRAGQRCGRLAAELAAVESSLAVAAAGRGMRWSGTAAAAFGARTTEHRRVVADTRVVVERLGALAIAFAEELAEAQRRARTTDANAATSAAADERISLSRARFRRQVRTAQADLIQVRLRLAQPSGRWTGPVVLPPGLGTRPVPLPPGRWTGPLPPPPGSSSRPVTSPGRWAGPVVPPPGLGTHPLPLPAPARAAPVGSAPLTGGTRVPA